jgi:hypothetical protein
MGEEGITMDDAIPTFGLDQVGIGKVNGLVDDGVTEFVLLRLYPMLIRDDTTEPIGPVDFVADWDMARNLARMLNEACDNAGIAP